MKEYKKRLLKTNANINNDIVHMKERNINLTPFSSINEIDKNMQLPWWHAFTSIKHNRTEAFQKASLENCLNLLAALYLLENNLLLKIAKENKEMDIPNYPSALFYSDNSTNYGHINSVALKIL